MANKAPLVIETTLADAFSNLQKADTLAYQIDVAAAAPRAALAITDDVGSDAFTLRVSRAASRNIFMGQNPANGTLTGTSNIGLGVDNGNDLTTGASNVMIGWLAGSNITSGSNNVLLGVDCGTSLQTGGSNFALGTSALRLNVSGSNNVAIGVSAGSNLTGSINMCIGTNSGATVTTGNGNVFIGNNAGNNASQLATASSCVCIGLNSFTGGSTAVSIGASSSATGANAIAIGNAATAAANTCSIGASTQTVCSIVGGLVVNDAGGDFDSRIEGDTATNLFVIDAGLDAVQIGTTTAGVIADFRTAGVVFNEDGSDRDFRVEGDSLSHLLFLEGNAASENIALVASALPNWQAMDGGLFIENATTAPTGNPASGTFLYGGSGDLNVRNTQGAVTMLSGVTRGAAAAVADGGTITHNLGTTPTGVLATGSVAGEIITVTALGATTFTVAIKQADGTTAGTAQTIYWQAFK